MPGLFGGGGGPSSTQKNAWANLNSLFNISTQQGQQLGQKGTNTQNAGIADLNQVANYWKNLLSGNRQAIQQEEGPAINQITQGADAQKRQEAQMGTSRGGGTNATNQKRATDTQAQIDTLIGQAGPTAAAGLANVGSEIAGIGTADISAMLNALGIGVSAEGTVGGQATDQRIQELKSQSDLFSSLIKGAADIGAAYLGA